MERTYFSRYLTTSLNGQCSVILGLKFTLLVNSLPIGQLNQQTNKVPDSYCTDNRNLPDKNIFRARTR